MLLCIRSVIIHVWGYFSTIRDWYISFRPLIRSRLNFFAAKFSALDIDTVILSYARKSIEQNNNLHKAIKNWQKWIINKWHNHEQISACEAVSVEQCYIVYRLLPPPKAKVIFSSLLVCLSACLLVFCLSVRNITDKRVNGFHEIFRIGGTWCTKWSGTF